MARRSHLTSRLNAIAALMDGRMDAVLRGGAELVRDRAEARAPDAPPLGEGLKQSIHVNDSDADQFRYAVVAGDNDVFYAHMVEHGTSHSAPRPFLVPALEESRTEIVRNARKVIDG